jgi:exosortase/archaeosortase family protein
MVDRPENSAPSRVLRFCGRFVFAITAQLLAFEALPEFFGLYHLYPVSWMASQVLNLLGVQANLTTMELANGFCRLELTGIQYAVTHECTGILAVFVLTAAILAYPVPSRQRGTGLLMAIPAVTFFGVLRLVVLGIVAGARPGWIELFHLYIMELATLAFALFVFIYWIEDMRRD